MLTAFVFIHPIRVGPAFNVIGLSASVAMVIGARMHEPRQRLPWYLVATGQALFVAGDVITYNYAAILRKHARRSRRIGDLFYLSVYPFLIAGVLLLVSPAEPRARPRQPDRLPDHRRRCRNALMGVPAGPYAHDQSLTARAEADGHGLPASWTCSCSAVAVRLAVDRGKRPPAFYLMAGSVAVLFTHRHDLHADPAARRRTTTPPACWSSDGDSSTCCGALPPSISRWWTWTSRPRKRPSTPAQTTGRTRKRLVDRPDRRSRSRHCSENRSTSRVLAGCSALLFVLVLVRLNGLMVDVGEYRRTERQMREAEAKYRSLVEGLPAVVYIAEFGKDAAWTYISPKVESILGFTPDEWTGQADLWRERILRRTESSRWTPRTGS